MGTEAVQPQMVYSHTPTLEVHWSLTARIAFRFCFVYFGVYCLLTQIITSLIPLPNVEIADPSNFWPIRQVVFWTAAHIFGAVGPLVYKDSGSGDKTFDWVLQFCLLIVAIVATAVWSILDRKRANYSTLYRWFRLFIRFSLAGQMLVYGWAKAIPTQMPFPLSCQAG